MILTFFVGIPFKDSKKSNKLREEIDEKEVGFVYNHKRIAVYYLRTTFVIDLISIIPFFMYFYIINGRH